ncbi:sodium:calcium antiporter [Pelagibacterium xiamenense]|uniref:sodium:calcium antiporter n=1 Tax=Pelagibacterium xiamenense TaxID=2901140 RepID=UPI001E4A10CA|nr:sodium:calcium antiporter [Pelagibacterium xiamenense]MCD7060390.1 sodium:calcium antiporter [Pelagibacterium xiamenense]
MIASAAGGVRAVEEKCSMWNAMPTAALAAIFVVSGLMIFVSGLRLTGIVDKIADRTGLGEALVGAVLLGAATSLSGTVVSVTAAVEGRASLAFSNSVGGIAAQTVFLAVADMFYRKTNLEHAAADLANVFQGLVLVVLLALPFVAFTTPEFAVFGVHPVSFAIPVVYLFGLSGSRRVRAEPMWEPVETDETRTDTPDEEDLRAPKVSTPRLFATFGVLMAFMGIAGWAVAESALAFIDRAGVSESLVGALATAVVTSLPELVTTVGAVQRGALQLAVGGIIGGNTFDTLFLTLADVFYRPGSLYHAIGPGDLFWAALGILMTGILLGGLILRQKRGPARIGGESMAMVLVYVIAVVIQAFTA